ncbi:MAG: hypothetical protein Q4C14_02455 [Bacillota bacterium]|nr:hypothetical protein [Bacillota bacterium]
MSCNLLGCGSNGGVSIIWVIILLWLLFFNNGNCACGSSCTGSNSCNICGC